MARIVASADDPSACIEADWWWTTIVRGFEPPWSPAADTQNHTVMRSVVAAASTMARGGYRVVLDGVVGPWMLEPVLDELERNAVGSDYVVLRPDLAVCLERAALRRDQPPRVAGHPPLSDTGPIRDMWNQFADLGPYESHVIDTGRLGPAQSARRVLEAVDGGGMRLAADHRPDGRP